MHASIILSAVLIFCINGGLGRAINANDKVNFTLYYESLCPDCRQFMTTELHRAYQSVLDIANISIVPYGNAHETYDPTTQLYQFTCQHGAAECLGNLIHTCVLNFYPSVQQFMPFVYCMESTEGDVTTVAMRCADKTQIDFSKVDACTKSKLGNQLQHIYAVRTESLQPQHQYVPWVTINGVHTEELEREAERDLVKLICKTYKGTNPPPACSQ